MDTWCYILVGITGAVLFLYALFEIHYFLRMCLCVINARFLKRNAGILDTLHVTGTLDCWLVRKATGFYK